MDDITMLIIIIVCCVAGIAFGLAVYKMFMKNNVETGGAEHIPIDLKNWQITGYDFTELDNLD